MTGAWSEGSVLKVSWMLLAAFCAAAAPGFFACQNAARSADDFTFFAVLALATVSFAGGHYALLRRSSPVRRIVFVLIGTVGLLLVAIPVAAVIAFAACGHFHI
jgi:peptidoglycan/LPS O-acetylase OafA/YrhL